MSPGHKDIQKDKCTSWFIRALNIIAMICNQHRCPKVEECIINIWCAVGYKDMVYTMEYYTAKRKDEIIQLTQFGCNYLT